MSIAWNRVTRFSQVVAIALALLIFACAFELGRNYERAFILGAPTTDWVHFACAEGKQIDVQFYSRSAHLEFGGQRTAYLIQTISGSGARYANADESMVFWNKGDTAFVTENGTTTYAGCVVR